MLSYFEMFQSVSQQHFCPSLWQTVIANNLWNRFIQIISSTQGGVICNSKTFRMPSIVSLLFLYFLPVNYTYQDKLCPSPEKCMASGHSYVIITIFKYCTELIWNSVIPSAAYLNVLNTGCPYNSVLKALILVFGFLGVFGVFFCLPLSPHT